MISAEVICDSISDQNIRLTTFKLRYPKFIHGELMTHRVISRNASSSRAIPTAKLIEEVRNDALRAGPVFWGKNQPGMGAREELSNIRRPDGVGGHFNSPREQARACWRRAAIGAADYAEQMAAIGAAKEITNRLLEPFSHINVVATATEWDNFFGLRLDKGAQPEMRALAVAMWEARKASTPRRFKTYSDPLDQEWHLPFIDIETADTVDDYHKRGTIERINTLIKVSVARCARVSYQSFETGKRSTVEEDIKLYERLLGTAATEHVKPASPLHASPAEHQATPDMRVRQKDPLGVLTNSYGWEHPDQHGNFKGWRQYRKMLPGEAVAPLPDEYLPF